MRWLFPVLLTGCLRGLIADRGQFQATDIYPDRPRIVALSTAPLDLISGQSMQVDALILGPRGMQTTEVQAQVCGLGRDTRTRIRGVDCFEDPAEVTDLGRGVLPLSMAVPDFQLLEVCEDLDTGIAEDDQPKCFHRLPLLLSSEVDGEPIYAASIKRWHPELPDRPPPTALASVPQTLQVSERAAAGSSVDLSIELALADTELTFNWYIDAGELEGTGQTIVHEYEAPTAQRPSGVVRSHNRWLLPDEPGELRVWVVANRRKGPNANMSWRQALLLVE